MDRIGEASVNEEIALPAAAETLPPETTMVAAKKGPSFTYLVATLAGGNAVCLVLRLIGGDLQLLFVLPAVVGLFSRIGLVQEYVRFLHIGILSGLNRELPYYYGKGDHRRVNELAATALAWSLGLGTSACIALMGVSAWYAYRGAGEMAAAWATNAVSAYLLFYSTMYLQSTYRTAHDFARLSLVNVIATTITVVLVVLVALLKFYGLCLQSLIAGLSAAVLLHYWRPLHIKPAWNWRQFRHLLWIGAPIFAVGDLLPQLWVTLDKQFVANIFGNQGMGLYKIAVIAGSTLETFPAAVSQVIYPRMTQHYGRTGRLGEVLRMAIKPMAVTLAGMTALAALGWWLAGPAIRLLLPNYVGGVSAMQWALLPPVLSSLFPIHNIYNVVRRQDLDAVALIIGMASYFGALWWLVRGGATLICFPQAILIGRAMHLTACYILLVPLVARARRSSP